MPACRSAWGGEAAAGAHAITYDTRQVLGHSSITTTSDTCTSLLPEGSGN
ncbi:hypothetical protein ABZ434_00945 [Streptomyces sp. NPDC005761]